MELLISDLREAANVLEREAPLVLEALDICRLLAVTDAADIAPIQVRARALLAKVDGVLS